MSVTKEILIGSNNPAKIHAFETRFTGSGLCILAPAELGISVEVEECGVSPAENARLKALAFHRASGLVTIAEDSGLYFLDLPKDDMVQPGVSVRRVNGKTMNDEEMIDYYSGIAAQHGGKLRAGYLDAYCVVKSEQESFLYESSKEESEAYDFYLTDQPHPSRTPGWPLDSISIDPVTGCYFADLGLEEWNQINEKRAPLRKKYGDLLNRFFEEILEIDLSGQTVWKNTKKDSEENT